MRDRTAFVAALDRLRTDAGLSWRRLEANARAQSLWLPRATANDAVKRGALPAQQDPAAFITAWTRACGADPEPWLRAWHETEHGTHTVPRHLPADINGFTGRDADLARLDALAATAADTPLIALVTGTAGAGKTALAIHWAHRAAPAHFPDGQLHIDLRGFSHDPPVEPEQALSTFLQALGVPNGEIPISLDAQTGLYRSLLAGRRILVLLDNAADARQVRPLLPGTPGCAVLITSRDRLTGLVAREGARTVELGRLDPAASRALITAIIGRERAHAENDALTEIARRCDHLPLALRISAANLDAQPHLTLADHLTRLTGADRLGALTCPGDADTAVRAAFDLSYTRLSPPARRLFRLLGVAPVTDFTLHLAAALTGHDPAGTAPHLTELAAAHLAEAYPHGRYAVHDLLRDYAAERTHAEDPSRDRQAAADRLWRWYYAHAQGACLTICPESAEFGLPAPWPDTEPSPFADQSSALAWLAAEDGNLTALVRHAADHGPRPLAWHLTDSLLGAWFVRHNLVDQVTLAEAALRAAIAEDATHPQAIAHHILGLAHWWAADYPISLTHTTRARRLYHDLGNTGGERMMIANLASIHLETGSLAQAHTLIKQGLVLVAPGPTATWGACQGVLAEILCTAGQHRAALGAAQVAQQVARTGADTRLAVDSAVSIARALTGLGDHQAALDTYQQAATEARAIDYLRGLADCHTGQAAIHLDRDDPAAATHHARTGHELAKQTGHRLTEGRTLTTLARLHHGNGDPATALTLATQALDLHLRHGQPLAEARALQTLAHIQRDLGDQEAADVHARRAHALLAQADAGH